MMDGTAGTSQSSASILGAQQPPPKEQYRVLKRRFKFLVYENECYQEELRNLQRKLLKLSRDKNFLLDRLMFYEKLGDSSDDSDCSVHTRVEDKKPKRKARPSQSKKKSEPKKDTSASGASLEAVKQEVPQPVNPGALPSLTLGSLPPGNPPIMSIPQPIAPPK